MKLTRGYRALTQLTVLSRAFSLSVRILNSFSSPPGAEGRSQLSFITRKYAAEHPFVVFFTRMWLGDSSKAI